MPCHSKKAGHLTTGLVTTGLLTTAQNMTCPSDHVSTPPSTWAAGPVSCNTQCNFKAPDDGSKTWCIQCFNSSKKLGKHYISKRNCQRPRGAPSLLTLIMALDVILKSVARSLTCLIFSLLSAGSFRDSSSLRERCRAVPCLAIKSLHVLRSSTLLESVRRVFWSSVLSVCETDSSSPDSSVGMPRWKVKFCL